MSTTSHPTAVYLFCAPRPPDPSLQVSFPAASPQPVLVPRVIPPSKELFFPWLSPIGLLASHFSSVSTSESQPCSSIWEKLALQYFLQQYSQNVCASFLFSYHLVPLFDGSFYIWLNSSQSVLGANTAQLPLHCRDLPQNPPLHPHAAGQMQFHQVFGMQQNRQPCASCWKQMGKKYPQSVNPEQQGTFILPPTSVSGCAIVLGACPASSTPLTWQQADPASNEHQESRGDTQQEQQPGNYSW